MALKAKKPEAITKRLKLFLFGSAGVGKTTAAIQFPNSYVIDCERGSENYAKLMQKSGSQLFQTVDCDEVIQEIRALGTDKHDFKTVVLDPITTMEQDLIAKAEKKYNGDMRMWGERDRYFRRLFNLLIALDMNVIVTAHGKVDYGANMVKLGNTFDGWKRLPYIFDLVIELERRGDRRVAVVRKTRLAEFPDGAEFDFSYQEFCKRYGADVLERKVEQKQVATAEQVMELNRLVASVKLADGITDKWLAKASVDSFDDMPSDTIQKCIDYVKNVINKATTAVAAE